MPTLSPAHFDFQLPVRAEPVSSDDPHRVRLMNMAQRELGAFMSAVTEAYGSEEAMLAARDWLNELEATDELPRPTIRDWRRITIAAAARLANRLVRSASHNTYEGVLCARHAAKARAAQNLRTEQQSPNRLPTCME
jgi:hypothetical protein